MNKTIALEIREGLSRKLHGYFPTKPTAREQRLADNRIKVSLAKQYKELDDWLNSSK